ncbi:proline-rich protein 36-like [Varroa destructor]|uniref:Uncharacterized protein n=1 Tax=Varroa destructor TaxID=109461 RepID=A0A7M7KB88_VARDE|nr:proline-rich protein 36-like [Varroa destructor]
MAYQPSSHFAPASNRRRMGGTGGEWPGKGWGGGVESAIGQQMQAVLGWLAGRPAGQPAARTTNASAAVKKASWRPPAPCHSCSRCAAAAAATAAVLLLDSTLLPRELPPLKLPLRPPLELTPHTRPQHSAPLSPLPASKRTNERRTSDRLSQQLRANPPLLPSPPPPLQQPPPPAVASLAHKQLDFARLADARHTHLPLARVVGAASSPLAPRRTAFSAPLAPPQHISASTTAGARRQPARLPPLMPLLFLSVCLCVSLGRASRHSLVRTRREIFSSALVPYLHPSVPPTPRVLG